MSTVPLEGLSDWIVSECRASAGRIAILAGHFAVFTAGGPAVDLLTGPVPERAPHEMLEFTRLSWEASCEAIASARLDVKLAVLADDITFVRPAVGDQRLMQRLGAELTAAYYAAHKPVPTFHQRMLVKYDVSERLLLHDKQSRCVFSERELRQEFVAHLKRIRRDGLDRKGLIKQSSDHPQSFSLGDGAQADVEIVRYGHATCAGGYLELLSRLKGLGIDTLIALIPLRCLNPVVVAVTLARSGTFDAVASVVNVLVPDPSSGQSAVIVRQ